MAGYEFCAIPAVGEEDMSAQASVEELTMNLSLAKAREIFEAHAGDVVIGSDTVVAIGGEVLGKPKNREDAKEMLQLLSGKSHTVYTGVAIISPQAEEVFCAAADVEFYPLTDREIEEYLDTDEYKDKAGAYGIQGFGALLIKGIRGDYYTIMGFPIAEVARRLKKYEKYFK